MVGRSSGILDEYASSVFAEATAYYIAQKLRCKVQENEVAAKLDDAKAVLNKRYPDNYEVRSKLVHCHEAGELLSEPAHIRVYAEDPRSVFVCFCEDVTLGDVLRGVRGHGFEDIELLKRYTGIGTGKCQGKLCIANAIHAMSDLTGKLPSAIGTFRQRPMVVSTSLESLEVL